MRAGTAFLKVSATKRRKKAQNQQKLFALFVPFVALQLIEATVDDFYDYFSPGKRWDMVHLGLFVDKENQRLLFEAGKGGSLSVEAVEGRIKDCGAQLVVIITCDSVRFGGRLARVTNVIAGYQPIAPQNALSWAKIFYQALSFGMPLSQAFDKAQDAVDPGLVLLARRDIRFRRLTG